MKTLLRFTLILVVLYLILYYSPTLLDFKPKGYSLPFPAFDGPLKENHRLSDAELLYKGVITGPESIVFHNGELYTGLEDGRIVKLKGNDIITIAQTGRQCNMPYEERLCGRPLGLRIGKDGLLYVIDAYYGIFNMNFSTDDPRFFWHAGIDQRVILKNLVYLENTGKPDNAGEYGALTRLLPSTAVIEGRELSFPDDMDLDDEGNIYFSDASAKWDLSTIYYLMTEYEGAGRIIKYNMHTGETEVLIKNLYFPNGVQISKDGKSLLICEISNRRVLRYYLKGPKKGKLEVFADVLPGEPDNIRQSPRGYWVALTTARNSTNVIILDALNPYPTIKYVWGRFHHALGTLFMLLAELSTSPVLKQHAYKFRRGDYVLPLLPRHGIIIELDEEGKILRSLQSPDGKISDLSQVTEHNGYLYLGSFVNDYLGRLKL